MDILESHLLQNSHPIKFEAQFWNFKDSEEYYHPSDLVKSYHQKFLNSAERCKMGKQGYFPSMKLEANIWNLQELQQ